MLDQLLPSNRTSSTSSAARPETVTELSTRIRNALEAGFRTVWVEGEISNLRSPTPSSPHAYFSLKDSGAQISCNLFGAIRRPEMLPHLRNGNKVRVVGTLSVYLPRGSYSITVSRLDPVGIGELLLQLEELKRKLAAEGLFDKEHKRPIPFLPRLVGVVTAPSGAAIQDILRISKEQNPGIDILLSPAVVQGASAAPSIVRAIQLFHRLPLDQRPDVLIVGRGGGSMEDLWCFNEEPVIRAIYQSEIPVASAVGHEIDHTLADYVADVAYATPSHAAKALFPPRINLIATNDTFNRRLHLAMSRSVQAARQRLSAAANARAFARPETILAEHSHAVDLLAQRLSGSLREAIVDARNRLTAAPLQIAAGLRNAMQRQQLRLATLSLRPAAALENALVSRRNRLDVLQSKLLALDPKGVLNRGYALVQNDSGEIITKAARLAPGDRIKTVFSDGVIQSRVLPAGDSPKNHRGKPAPKNPELRQPTLF